MQNKCAPPSFLAVQKLGEEPADQQTRIAQAGLFLVQATAGDGPSHREKFQIIGLGRSVSERRHQPGAPDRERALPFGFERCRDRLVQPPSDNIWQLL